MRKSQFQKTVAYHEAGHAVVARLLGVEIKHAFGSSGGGRRPIQGGSAHGNVTTHSARHLARGTPAYRQALKTDILICLAGIAAQWHYRPQSTKWTNETGEWESDKLQAYALATLHCFEPGDGTTDWCPDDAPWPPEVQALVSTSLAEVTKMVVDNWPKVERVAALLLKHGDATQADIDAAMAETARHDDSGAKISDGMDPQHRGNEELK